MSSSKNAKMIDNIINPPIKEKKMTLKELFIMTKKRLSRRKKKTIIGSKSGSKKKKQTTKRY
tara:strand:- start:1517 stop:1702 length:186 start_codon:yes stop_codon:yes gene_type:complete